MKLARTTYYVRSIGETCMAMTKGWLGRLGRHLASWFGAMAFWQKRGQRPKPKRIKLDKLKIARMSVVVGRARKG
jgi:hypothetical protein